MRRLLLSWLGARWIHRQRGRHSPASRPLSSGELECLKGYFDEKLLASVRLCRIDRVSRPWFVGLLAWFGMPLDMDFRSAAGITFGDLILISGSEGRPIPPALLFHEMVHVLQYRALGIEDFSRAYVRGWLDGGRAYLAIPLEKEAYAFEDRFRAGDLFRVGSRWESPSESPSESSGDS